MVAKTEETVFFIRSDEKAKAEHAAIKKAGGHWDKDTQLWKVPVSSLSAPEIAKCHKFASVEDAKKGIEIGANGQSKSSYKAKRVDPDLAAAFQWGKGKGGKLTEKGYYLYVQNLASFLLGPDYKGDAAKAEEAITYSKFLNKSVKGTEAEGLEGQIPAIMSHLKAAVKKGFAEKEILMTDGMEASNKYHFAEVIKKAQDEVALGFPEKLVQAMPSYARPDGQKAWNRAAEFAQGKRSDVSRQEFKGYIMHLTRDLLNSPDPHAAVMKDPVLNADLSRSSIADLTEKQGMIRNDVIRNVTRYQTRIASFDPNVPSKNGKPLTEAQFRGMCATSAVYGACINIGNSNTTEIVKAQEQKAEKTAKETMTPQRRKFKDVNQPSVLITCAKSDTASHEMLKAVGGWWNIKESAWVVPEAGLKQADKAVAKMPIYRDAAALKEGKALDANEVGLLFGAEPARQAASKTRSAAKAMHR